MTKNQETTFKVEGMTCGSCVRHINEALRDVDGVRDIDVRLREGKVRVTHENVSADTIIEALREAGYESRTAA